MGTPIAGRNRREVEGLIGFFVNTLVLRVDGSGAASFRELLRPGARDVLWGPTPTRSVPFEQLVEALQPARDLSRSPLFQVMFVLPERAVPALALPGVVRWSALAFEPGMAKFDLTLFVRETPEGLVSLWSTTPTCTTRHGGPDGGALRAAAGGRPRAARSSPCRRCRC